MAHQPVVCGISAGFEEKRAARRIALSVPVTVTIRRRRGEPYVATGRLRTISSRGAAFTTDHELLVGERVVLRVHCEHPVNGPVKITFPSEVVRVVPAADWEVAVKFRGRHKFVLDSLSGVN